MIFAFLVSFFSFAHIDVGSQFYISELLLALYLFFSISKFRLLSESLPRKILLLGFFWLISQVLTDMIRDTPSENYLRGWAAIIFFLIDFCAVYIMVRCKPYLLRVLLLGAALGAVLGVISFPSEYSEIEPWKFGYGFPITMLLLLYLSTGDKYKAKWAPMLLVFLGALSIYLNARSLGGITILTAVVLYLSKNSTFVSYAKQRRNPIKLVGLSVAVLLIASGIASLYQLAAESGYLPENVTAKYELGKTRDDGLLGNLLGGRSEILISSQAVIDSPFIGHGSWPENSKYTYMRYDIADKLGLDISDGSIDYSIQKNSLIPTHSVIMQAWVWAGFMGAFFWFFVLRYIVRVSLATLTVSNAYQPIIIFTSISGIWNLLFSPFGAGERFYWTLVLMIFFIASTKAATKPINVRKINKGFK
jgi:hypothetical protein